MRRSGLPLILALLAAACSDGPSGGDDYVSPLYSADDKWVCRPGLAENPCLGDFDATVVEAGGAVRVEPYEVGTDPPFDCFYVYPTVNGGPEPNAGFDGDYGAEIGTTRMQAGPFASLCRMYAPLYRQITLSSFGNPAAAELAHSDVLDAWRHYLAQDNDGRGFVLMGHSQGSSQLVQLIAEEIDGNPRVRDRLISALLIGSTVRVPEGADVGGDFQNVPACRDPRQTGCVVSFASFRATSPPPPNSFFARPSEGEGRAVCTNPAALAGGRAELHPYFERAFVQPFAPGVQEPPITTPFVALPGLVSGECVDRGEFTYLEITLNADPADPRTDQIRGDITPEWGLHAVDIPLTLGDLLDLVAEQADAWLAARR